MMLTCQDCFHFGVCDYHITELTTMTVNECSHKFVNKADVAEVRHGYWEENRNGTFTCSVCGGQSSKMDWCGRCGAKMDGKGDV